MNSVLDVLGGGRHCLPVLLGKTCLEAFCCAFDAKNVLHTKKARLGLPALATAAIASRDFLFKRVVRRL